ncbi:MAG: DUF47 family protein [Oscillospiraceae bacterium]|jgi:uncharacterized protein Yka (UPF0111/DUF47 family)|nr:DUF47 family protein [Oscillospiraceae bacterium]
MPKDKYDYFHNLEAQAACLSRAANALADALRNYDFLRHPEVLNLLREELRQSRFIRRAMTEALIADFLPPMERADLMDLTVGLDRLTASAEHALRQVYSLQVPEVPDAVSDLAGHFARQADCVAKLLGLLPHRKKVTEDMLLLTREMGDIEEACDEIVTGSQQTLFSHEPNTRSLLVWTVILEQLVTCTDLGNRFAFTVEAAVMKNI